MKQQSKYNIWILRLIYLLGMSAAAINLIGEDVDLKKEIERPPSPNHYISELQEELRAVLENATIKDICRSPLQTLSKIDRFGSISYDLAWNTKLSSLEKDTLRRCRGKTSRPHSQMETICFKFIIDQNLVDKRSFLSDPNHIIELNIIPQSFDKKAHISCNNHLSQSFYDGSLAMLSIYWQTKNQVHRRNLAFSSKSIRTMSH